VVEQEQEFELPSGTVRFRSSGHTTRGSVRRINEDAFYLKAPVFAVADGMGGHAHGDRASQAAVAAFDLACPDGSPMTPAGVLEAIRDANTAVCAVGDDGEPGTLSGTTLTGVAFVDLDLGGGSGENLHWMAFNVGDSRAYAWDGRTLTQITVDHSAVQELVDRGELTRAEAERHPQRNVVTRALGADDEVEPDVWLLPARGRQTFILCSDGLTKELDDEEIARVIVYHDAHAGRDAGNSMSLAERLAKAAVAAGGSDNVTVLVVESESAAVGGSRLQDDTLDRGALSPVLEDTRPRGGA
jgi:serine/threonine protein phosphatase PrpC